MDELQTTDDGTEYRISGGRVVIPTPDHEDGGGIALTAEDANAILSDLLRDQTAGEYRELLEWEVAGSISETRVGPSKDIRVSQTSFNTERTATLTIIDIADLELEAREAGA